LEKGALKLLKKIAVECKLKRVCFFAILIYNGKLDVTVVLQLSMR